MEIYILKKAKPQLNKLLLRELFELKGKTKSHKSRRMSELNISVAT